jgi:hypothetical protein
MFLPPINGLRLIKSHNYKHLVPTARKSSARLYNPPADLLAVYPRTTRLNSGSPSTEGRMLITTDFETGVLLLSATLRSGTSTLVSGK